MYRKNSRKLSERAWMISFCFVLLCVTVGAVGAACLYHPDIMTLYQETSAPAISQKVLIIDAGHGGVDGGAVAPDGTCEKEITLPIALKTVSLHCYFLSATITLMA